MIGGLFNSLGVIPDVLRGKQFQQALIDNAIAVPTAAAGADLLSAPTQAMPSYSAANFGTPAGYGGVNAAVNVPKAGGLLDGFKAAASYAQPFAQAASAAGSIKGLLSEPQMQAPQMMPTQNTGAQSLVGLAQSGQQQIDQLMSEDMKRRMANQQIIQSMMGRNYG